MLIRTHLAITIFAILIFISHVEHQLVFVLTALVATFIPDVDLKVSTLGKRKFARILQSVVKHRGVMHSYTFLVLVTFILILFFPIIGFGFFLGYGLHLFADSFTVKGIRAFHPATYKSKGPVKTGSKFEITLFLLFVFLNVVLLGYRFIF